MAFYTDYHQVPTSGERLFSSAQKAPYQRQDTDDTLVDYYYDLPISLDTNVSTYASSSSSGFQLSHTLTPASSIESSYRSSEDKEPVPSMSDMHRYLRGNYSHVSPLNNSSFASVSRTALDTKVLPATAAEEQEMLITPIDQGITDRDFAARGRGFSFNTSTPQPLHRTHRTHPSISTTLDTSSSHNDATPAESYSTFHDRVSANFDPVRDAASPRHSVLSSRTMENKRWSILSMQQAMMEPPKPLRPAKWFERMDNATFTLKLAPRGMTSAKPKSASSGVSATPISNAAKDDDWELPVLADDPLALSRLLVSALFTMQDIPGDGEGPKQHAVQLVPARASGAKHFAMKQVKADPLAGGKTGEEGKEGEGVVVSKAPEAKKVMWKISFRAAK